MHATISVICNKHKVLSNGESPIVLRIAKGGKRAIKSLGISINPSHWDEQKEQAKPICPNKKQIDLLVLKTKTEYQKKVLEKSVNDEDFTPQSLLFDEQKSIKVATVEEFYQAIIKELRAKGNIGNSYAYLNSYNSLKNFNKGKKLTYPFGYIDVPFLKKY
ncbi:phage integrase SAM-like domain-containing protein, partial [Parabacteroides sp. OttesenSCG-928-G06]|nr:phage integrase SAM-like domain-containing protein [Parabacteroides sp. OttesenSCG-928-G06]